jgi:hypothetical protein
VSAQTPPLFLDPGSSHDWTALDFRTGEGVWQKMAGTGHEKLDTFYPAVFVGPNETLYVGLIGRLANVSCLKNNPARAGHKACPFGTNQANAH